MTTRDEVEKFLQKVLGKTNNLSDYYEFDDKKFWSKHFAESYNYSQLSIENNELVARVVIAIKST